MSDLHQFEQPFPGLRPYEMDDAPLFFGRHTHVAEMISLLERQRFLAVVGASGSGKSSLVRAGLLPAIRDGYVAVDSDPDDDIWRIAITRPGDDPYRALAESLVTRVLGDSLNAAILRERTTQCEAVLRASQYGLTNALRGLGVPATDHVVVLVDQFEELFRFRRDEATRNRAGIRDESTLCERRNDANAFVNMLLKSCQQVEQFVFVILTMRSDFLGDCDAFIGLPEAISRSQYLTPRLTRSQLEEAIRGPLALPKFQTTIADDLVTRILNDVGTEPDQLSLMQHALMRTWQRTRAEARRKGTPARPDSSSTTGTGKSAHPTELSIADYEHVGGVSGALDQHADEIFNSLRDETTRGRLQYVAERVFCSLSERRDGSPLTRRPIKVSLAALESGATESDVEAVAQAFQAANLWVYSPPGLPLGPDTRLDISHESLLRQWAKLQTWIDLETKSAQQYRRLRDEAENHARFIFDSHLDHAQEWSKSRHPNAYWGMRYDGSASPSASPFQSCLALIDRSIEERERRLQDERIRLERENVQERDRLKAEVETRRAREAEAAALREHALQKEKAGVEALRAQDAEAASARFARRTKAALVACMLAVIFLGIALWGWRNAQVAESKATTAERIAKSAKDKAEALRLKAEKLQSYAHRENADFCWKFAILARDTIDSEPVKAAHLFLRGASSLGRIVPGMKATEDEDNIRANGLAASALDQLRVRRWVHNAAVLSAQFSRDESRVLTFSSDHTARLWDVTKPDPLQTFKHDNAVNGVQFNHDESRLLTWSEDKTVRLWDVTKSKPLQTFEHGTAVYGAQFSRDESRLLTWTGERFSKGGEVMLWDVTKPEPLQTFKHDGAVYGAQFSRDESHVLTWSNDTTARLWDVTKLEAVQTFKHDGAVYGAQFSRDESRVLTWSNDKTARLWDVTKPEPVQTFKHNGGVNGAQFSRDESRVLTWSGDPFSNQGEARLWDVTKPEAVQTFKHDSGVRGAQFSRDESRMLTWSDDKTARLWDVTKPEAVQTFNHDDDVKGAQFSRDESRVLTWSYDGTARLWDVTKPETVQTFKHDGLVYGAQFSRDESRVLTWSYDGTARLWDVTKPETVQTFKHDGLVYGAQFSRDESHVLTWSGDNTARLWDVTKPEAVQTFKHDGLVYGAQFSRDESRVLTWSGDNTGRLWDVTKPEPLQTFQHDDSVNGAQFSRNELRVLTWSGDKTARLWDVTMPEAVQTFKHDRLVNGAQFSRDESRVLTWSADNTARLWDVTEAEAVQTFKHDDYVNGAQFSRDESRVLTWSDDNTARLWEVTKPEAVQTFKHDESVTGVQFSRDESRLLTWSYDGTARLWEVTKPEAVQTFKHGDTVDGAQFSRDESRLLTWSYDGTARLWDLTKSEEVQTFKHDASVKGVQFSRDGSRVLTWSGDNTARLWDVTKPEAVQTFKHDAFVNGVQFSRDGSRVLTWSGDNTARLWDVTKAEAVQTFKHHGIVRGAQFSRDESRVLTWSGDRTARLWNLTDPLNVLQPAERILELEVRSGATLDQQLNLRTLTFNEWQTRVMSPEYRVIEQKLAARTAKPAPPTEATSDRTAHEAADSQSTVETNNPPQPARPLDESLPSKKPSPTIETGPVNSTTLWVCLFLLGFVGLNVLVVFASKTRSQSQTKRDV